MRATGLSIILLTQAVLSHAAPASAPDRPPARVDCSDFPPVQTSPYILPWRPAETYTVARSTSHWTPRNHGVGLYAVDILMPIGTKVTAAREGTVVALYEEFVDENGNKREDLKENYLFIRHDDGTIGRYFHLTHDGVLVNLGQRVQQGEVVALSGKTGTPAPHLHFDVQGCGPNRHPDINKYPCGQTVPVTYRNAGDNACGLIGGASYTALPFHANTAESIDAAERAEIVKTVTDYVVGWQAGKSERVRRALHPQLSKLVVSTDSSGAAQIGQASALSLIEQTESALGAPCTRIGGVRIACEGAPDANPDVAILERSHTLAAAKIQLGGNTELLQLAKINGRWLITSILAQPSPDLD